MKVKVRHQIDRLTSDYTEIAVTGRAQLYAVVGDGIDLGRDLSRALAKESAGRHGKHYPNAITSEMADGLGLFGNTISGEWGPEANRRQGDMSFERGSRNQPPHNDLAQAADKVGPATSADVRRLLTRLFT